MDGRLVSRDADWPQPFKYRSFKDRGLYVHVTVEKPVKGLVCEGRDGSVPSDSTIDVMHGDEQVVTGRGLKEGDEPLIWKHLGKDK
jgi:beta-mannosidase